MLQQIVVVTSEPDPHLDLVLPHTQKRQGFEVVIVDPWATVKGGPGISYILTGDKNVVWYGSRCLANVVSVWWRKPEPIPAGRLPVSPEWQQHCAESILDHVRTLRECFPEARWISGAAAVRRANQKPFQVAAARKLGLRTPSTILTSSPEQAEIFAAALLRQEGSYIAKSTSQGEVVNPDDPDGLYLPRTRRFYSTSQVDWNGMRVTPGIVQSYVQGQDIRVVAIRPSRRVFSAAIVDTAADETTRPDCRIGGGRDTLIVTRHSLPADVENKLLAISLILSWQWESSIFVSPKKTATSFSNSTQTGNGATLP